MISGQTGTKQKTAVKAKRSAHEPGNDQETHRTPITGTVAKEAATMADNKSQKPTKTNANSEQGIPMDSMNKPAALNQDPHALREPKENNLEIAIGHEVRALRKKLGITIADLASATGISMGMLSKIENGVTSPSLTSLQALASALGVPLTDFFRRYEEPRNAVFVKSGEGIAIERRGTRAGHEYNLLGHIDNNTSGVVVEPYLLTLTEESSSFPAFQHEGMEFIYMLEGEVRYRHGDQLYYMQAGDSLFFDADARHGPEELLSFPIRYLSIICYPARS